MAQCSTKGCIKIGIVNSLCHKHRFQTQQKIGVAAKYPHHKLYNTVKWQNLRKRKLSINPVCEECQQAGNEIDHIIDHVGDRKLFYDLQNLQTLCKSCHSRKTLKKNIIDNIKQLPTMIVEIVISKDNEKVSELKNYLGYEKLTHSFWKTFLASFSNKKYYVKNSWQAKMLQESFKWKFRVQPTFKISKEK